MNVLFLNPKFPLTYWGFQLILWILGKRAIFPPLGLITIAPMFPKSWGERLRDINAGQNLRPCDLEWADMVCITGMLIQKDELRKLVRQCKAAGKLVLVGGPYISTSTQDVPEADHVFIGECELTLPQFLADLAAGTTKRVYENKLKPGSDKEREFPDMARVPIPDYSLLDLSLYNTMSIQFVRGCPFDCDFCDITKLMGKVSRYKSNEQLLAELSALHATGYLGSVFLVDDNFIGNPKRIRDFLPALIAWQKVHAAVAPKGILHWLLDRYNQWRQGGKQTNQKSVESFPFAFYTEASVNLGAEEEILNGMEAAGFTKVFLGIESPVKESLKNMHKWQNAARPLLEMIANIQRHLEVMGGYIVGNDTDPDNIADLQIDFIRESAVPMAMVAKLTALPDTNLYKRLEREGRLIGESDGDNTGGGELNFRTVRDPKVIVADHRRILQTVYRSKEYYGRVLDLFKRLPRATRSDSAELTEVQQLAIFAKTVWLLGILERERVEFWRFLWRATREHQDRFADAIRLAIAGYHQRQLANREPG